MSSILWDIKLLNFYPSHPQKQSFISLFSQSQYPHQDIKPLKLYMQKLKSMGDEFGPKYQTKNLVGTGAYGEVFEAVNKETGQKVAIKKFKGLFTNKFIALRALRQVALLRVINSPRIIKIYQIIPPADESNFDTLAVVLEYLPFDLKRIYEKSIIIEDLHVESIIYQLVVGLRYLKSAGILHRDLKPENILMDKNHQVKLCDFGLARSVTNGSLKSGFEQLSELSQQANQTPLGGTSSTQAPSSKQHQLTLHVVTRWYRAPELILLQSQYDMAIEMWSVGCILAQIIGIHKKNKKPLFKYKPLFDGKACFPLSPPKKQMLGSYKNENGFPHSDDDQISKILNVIGTPSEEDSEWIKDKYALGYIRSFPPRPRKDLSKMFQYSKPEWIDFLDKTLVFSPKKRMTVEQALQHPIFKNVRDPPSEKPAELGLQLTNLHSGLSIQEIRGLFIQEINYYR